MTTEGDRVAGFGRLEDGLKQASPWYTWGPYVSEQQWGTVREDYSEDGDAWNYEADTIHVLPTAWFRNTWSWDGSAKPSLTIAANGTGSAADAASGVDIEPPFLGALELLADTASDGAAPKPLFCENETNNQRLWSKQFYHYNVARWLDGDPARPAPPPDRELNRNARWRNFDAFDILSMPDKWEYPGSGA